MIFVFSSTRCPVLLGYHNRKVSKPPALHVSWVNCLHCQSHSFQRTQPIHSKTFNIIRFPSLDPTYGYIFSSIECTQFLLDDKKPESSSIHSIYKVHVCATIKFKDMSFFLLSELILGSFVMTFGSNGGHVSSRIEISP